MGPRTSGVPSCGSIEPSSAASHTSGRVRRSVNGPSGAADSATPMHCLSGAVARAT